MNCDELIKKGIKAKENRDTNLALSLYKQALDAAETDKEKAKVWQYILHIHTDKMLSTLMKIAEVYDTTVYELKMRDSDKRFEWVFGTNWFVEGSNKPNLEGYTRPNDESLFR